MPLTYALAGLLRSGAGRSGWPIAIGVVMPLYALSGVARSGATRSNYHSNKVFVSVGGVQWAFARSSTALGIRDNSLTVNDNLNATPNTAQFIVKGAVPALGQDVVITLGSINNLWRQFGGQVLSLSQFEITAVGHQQGYRVSAIDYTWGLNKRKVIGHFTGSATTIANTLLSTYAPGYVSRVEAGLPTVDGGITFTNQDLTVCLTQLMKRIGGDWYCDYSLGVHCFLTDVTATDPTIVNAVHRSLREFQAQRDLSQVVTRVYVEGGGSQAFAGVAIGETILPVTDPNWYNAAGGVVVVGAQRLTYTGRSLGGGGGLVGPGAAPSGVPVLALASGAGVESGAHSYGVTFVTAAGESVVSPLAAITVGVVAAPASAPTAGTPTIGTGPNPGSHDYALTFVTASGETTASPLATKATTLTAGPSVAPTPGTPTTGGSVDAGVHDYAVSFVTSIGETTPSPISGQQTTSVVSPPTAAPMAVEDAVPGAGTTSWNIGDAIYYVVTYLNAAGETIASAVSATIVATDNGFGFARRIDLSNIPVSGDATVTSKRLYRHRNAAWAGYLTLSAGATTYEDFTGPNAGSPPGANGATIQTVPLTAIPTGDANVTSRNLYRRSGGAGLKLLTTIANNTATTYTDTTANASLGAAVPASSTAYLQRIPLSAIPLGGALVTSRNLYGTAAGGSQLKLIATLNTTDTTYTVTTTDAGLGANVPTSNTATANQVAISGVPLGAAAVTSRKIYRTTAGGAQLKLQQTIANNTATTGVTDATADASLGANVPTSDASGLVQPEGQVNAGATSLIVAGTGAFSATGGWAVIGNGQQVIRYTGVTGNTLIGIPASGAGSIAASIGYNSTVTTAPQLTGIPSSGAGSILYTILRGDNVNLLAQVDDVAAQAALAALIGGDGIQDEYLQDGRLAYAEAVSRGTAQLELKGSAEIGISYTARDINTRAGRTVDVNIGAPVSVTDDFLIQQVTVSYDTPNVMPLHRVQASNARFTFAELLRMINRNEDN